MQSVVIVVVAPCRNHAAGMAQRREQVFVEAFLPHPAVEAVDQYCTDHLSAWIGRGGGERGRCVQLSFAALFLVTHAQRNQVFFE
mgnify:CR=1 FL=1